MDRPIDKSVRRWRSWRRRLQLIAGLLAVAAATGWGMRQSEPAPTVSSSTLTTAVVERADFVDEVRARGQLDARRVQFISATSPGRIDALHAEAGATVEKGQPLVTLANSDVSLAAAKAEAELANAVSDLERLKSGFKSRSLELEGEQITISAELERAEREASNMGRLAGSGVAPADHVSDATTHLRTTRDLLTTTRRKRSALARSRKDEIAAQESRIRHLKEVRAVHAARVADLVIVAPRSGTLKELPVQIGEWVPPGRLLGKIIDPQNLEVVAKVSEAQIGRVVVGMHVRIALKQAELEGEVRAIAPASKSGSVETRITVEDPLPASARVDQGVEVYVQLNRLTNVVTVRRPVGAAPNGWGHAYVLAGGAAQRRSVRFGPASGSNIVVEEGLHEGDSIVVSETSKWQNAARVRVVD